MLVGQTRMPGRIGRKLRRRFFPTIGTSISL